MIIVYNIITRYYDDLTSVSLQNLISYAYSYDTTV